MPRPTGSPKTPGSGRKKGTRNKATKPIRDAIRARDPIGRLFELAAECRADGDRDLEHRVLATVLPYGFPKLAASQVDVRGLQGDIILEVVSKRAGDDPAG